MVPDDFEVPRELAVRPRFRLEPLGPQHNAADLERLDRRASHAHPGATPGFEEPGLAARTAACSAEANLGRPASGTPTNSSGGCAFAYTGAAADEASTT